MNQWKRRSTRVSQNRGASAGIKMVEVIRAPGSSCLLRAQNKSYFQEIL